MSVSIMNEIRGKLKSGWSFRQPQHTRVYAPARLVEPTWEEPIIIVQGRDYILSDTCANENWRSHGKREYINPQTGDRMWMKRASNGRLYASNSP